MSKTPFVVTICYHRLFFKRARNFCILLNDSENPVFIYSALLRVFYPAGPAPTIIRMVKWKCTVCNYVYDEKKEGVRFEDPEKMAPIIKTAPEDRQAEGWDQRKAKPAK